MDRWKNKVAVVTGASTGIGATTTLELVRQGLNVIGLARSIDKIEALKAELSDNLKPNLNSYYCNVMEEASIIEAFNYVEFNYGGVDVLVNNAGVICKGFFSDPDNSYAINQQIATNFTGAVFCTRQTLMSLNKRNVDGHIININSRLGHQVPKANDIPPIFNVYNATKFAITGFTNTLIQELDYLGKRTKVTSISPGATATERVKHHFDEKMLENAMKPEDVAQAIVYALSTPPNVQVSELTIKPVKENL